MNLPRRIEIDLDKKEIVLSTLKRDTVIENLRVVWGEEKKPDGTIVEAIQIGFTRGGETIIMTGLDDVFTALGGGDSE